MFNYISRRWTPLKSDLASYTCLMCAPYSCFAALPTGLWGRRLSSPDEDYHILHSTIVGTN